MSFKENKYHIRIPDDLREPCLWIYILMVSGSPYTAREVEHQYRCALYLLNTICPDMAPNTPTYTILDLGGGSTQTVFEPMSASEGHLEKGGHKHELLFGRRNYILHRCPYPGYSLIDARTHIDLDGGQLMDFVASLRLMLSKKESENYFIDNPSPVKGTGESWRLKMRKSFQV